MTEVGWAVTVGIVVFALIFGALLTTLIARVIILVIAVGLTVYVWQQRSSITDHIKKCNADVSFFGFQVDTTQAIKDVCHKVQHPSG